MCGLVSSKSQREKQSIQQSKILRAHQSFCKAYRMQSIDETIEYEPKSRKWTVNVKPMNEMNVYRLELMIHDRKNCRKISAKRLTGTNLMTYNTIHTKDDVVCFLYHSLGNVRKFVENCKLVSGREKEAFLRYVLVDLMVAVSALDRAGQCHTQLAWENVEVIEDEVTPQKYRGKLSALEFVKSKRDVKAKDLAPIEHLPPEILNGSSNISFSKALTYILGSMMMELLINKYMSGINFQTSKPNLTTTSALELVKQNSKQLPTLLASSTLSEKMQSILINLLEYDYTKRCTLSQLLHSTHQYGAHETPSSFKISSASRSTTSITTQSAKGEKYENIVLKTENEVPIDVETNEEGVFIDGAKVVSMNEATTRTIKQGAKMAAVTTDAAATDARLEEHQTSTNHAETLPAGGTYIDLTGKNGAESRSPIPTATAASSSSSISEEENRESVITNSHDDERADMSIRLPENEVVSIVNYRRRPSRKSSPKRMRKRYASRRRGMWKTPQYDTVEVESDYY